MDPKNYASLSLIANYTPVAYYAAEKEGKHLLLLVRLDENGETVEEKQMADYAALENEALAVLNEGCDPEIDGVYIPQETPEKYFSELTPVKDLPGCFVGIRNDKKYIIMPRQVIEFEPEEEGAYFPLLFAHLFPGEEEEAEMFALLSQALKG